jgi:aminopeptidase N
MGGLGALRAERPFSFANTPGKLPKDVVPRHYAITLKPDSAKLTTEGEVTIELEVLQATSRLVFNALELEFASAAVDGRAVAAPTIDAGEQTATVALASPLAAGKHTLRLAFHGKIGRQAQGLYAEKYRTAAGEKQMLGTQMEPTDARRMFPCWDEPVFRAKFQLTVNVPAGQTAVSNMPVGIERTLADGSREVAFGATPPMASYLVVLCVGEFEVLRDEIDGVQLAIYTTEGKRERARYAMESTKRIVHFYNDYFGVNYPLPKLDQIAVPGGFSGAMENWGGIVYNESTLLFDPATSSQGTKEEVFATVAHEIAHQWFGNLVTTAWWDNLWLNEGFASWMGTKATDHFNPGWQVWLRANSEKEGAMGSDARPTTHAIQQPITSESGAADAFDSITYLKGQSFLRMLETYLGEKDFRAGIRGYMATHAYGSTTTANLWSALEKSSGKPVGMLAAGWTEQPGFPVVNVSTRENDGRTEVTVAQEHFTINDPAPVARAWKIPLTLASANDLGAVQSVLLEGSKDTVWLSLPPGAAVKANVGNRGFYRVAYAPALAAALAAKLPILPEEDRVNLVSDAWALVEAGRGEVANYLDLVARLNRGETSLAVWEQVQEALARLQAMERGMPGEAAFRQWRLVWLRGWFARIGWDARAGEASTDTQLRSQLISGLGALGDPEVLAEARARFAKFLVQPDSLAANLRSSVLFVVGRHADTATWEKLYGLARAAQSVEDQGRYYGALQRSEDAVLAKRALALSLTDELPAAEAVGMVRGVAGRHPALAWDFAREHADALLAKITFFSRNSYFPSIAQSFNEAARADELITFVAKKLPPEAGVEAEKAADDIRFKAALKTRLLPAVDVWIAARKQ